MDVIRQQDARILITTPDYLPKIGGLSTFTVQIETILKAMHLPYDLFVWHDVSKLKSSKSKLGSYDVVFNIQSIGSFFMDYRAKRVVNFIHGSEILFHSPNVIKRMIKKVLKRKIFSSLEKSFFNVFISDFTKETIVKQGFSLSYSRDITFHNCTDTTHSKLHVNDINEDEWRFVCVARNVPHKNLDGVRKLCHSAFKYSGKKIKLFITADVEKIPGVDIVNILGIGNDELADYYKNSHFNTLLSLDHSHKGFFEGFGLTVLESALYGTPSIVSRCGGLPEAVHDNDTGWVVRDLNPSGFDFFWSHFNSSNYESICQQAYDHTLNCHGLDSYQKLIERCLL